MGIINKWKKGNFEGILIFALYGRYIVMNFYIIENALVIMIYGSRKSNQPNKI